MLLPKGWVEATLPQIIGGGLFLDGDWIESKDQDPNGDVRLIQLADIGDGDFRNKSDRYLTSDTASRLNCTFLEPGDCLVARLPDPLGRACVFPGLDIPCITVVDVCIVRTSMGPELNKFLMYAINSEQVRHNINLLKGGTTRARISRGNLGKIPIPLPPLNEQRRIVAKLEKILTKLQNAQAHLDKIPESLKQARRAILSVAMSGKLTEDWRNRNKSLSKNMEKILKAYKVETFSPNASYLPKLPESWLWIKLKDVGHIQTGIAKNARKHFENPITLPYLRVANVQDGYLDLGELKTITIDSSNIKRYSLIKGDVLFCEGGDYDKVGRGAVWEAEVKPCVHQNHIFSVRLKSNLINPYFLSFYRSSEFSKQYFSRSAKQTTNLASINSTQLKEFLVPYCPIEEQQEIVRQTQELFSRIDRIEVAYKMAKKKVDALTQIVLDKAFKGELVPQDPNDEPASVLLNKINNSIAFEKRMVTSKVKKVGVKMKPKEVIPVLEALTPEKAISSQELLFRAGYPNSASTEEIEKFFLDIREQLQLGNIKKKRYEDEDFFSLPGGKEE